MKPYLMIVLLALSFYGCRTVRQVHSDVNAQTDAISEVDYKSMYESQLNVNLRLEQKIAVLTAENVKLSSDVNTHEIEYDTDKPIDPLTNNPPKKREIIQSNKQHSESIVNKLTDIQSNLNVESSLYLNMIDDLQLQLRAKTKAYEDYKSSVKIRMAIDVWWFWGLLGFATAVSIMLAIRRIKFLR